MTRTWIWTAERPRHRSAVRLFAAATLRGASLALARLAARLDITNPAAASGTAQPAIDPMLEFHAEAGAPEGALFRDGQLVGHVRGVNRL